MKVRDVMSAPAVVLVSYASIRDVARHMDYNGVGCVVLLDGQRVVGIVTDRDLALRALAHGVDADLPVREVMTPEPVVTVRPGDDLDVAFQTFRRHAFRRLPVLEEGVVVGMVSVDDLLLQVHQVTADLLRPLASEINEPQSSM
ncbi:cyclic nucleotide-binding/CBS domain-containing protein [Nonomuraea pusilla]|uniref:CBS domain-containing protein n=1 Tax=Nonomuraea pusilla TaxID=46177 RepID=A0A1H8BWH7_9ACTN|nr:CBS domain-containing protein [Nonomuraea pusilla]SEM86919.1 CBS domain-containing protein [Nonomuraea pusilla]